MVIALERAEGRGLEIKDYAGLGRKYPALAAAMTIFMLSLIGLPPTLGFVGKFYLFSSVIAGGFYGLAIIGVLTSLVSAYYYLRVEVTMYMQDGEPVRSRESFLDLTTGLTAVSTVVISLVPQFLFAWATKRGIEIVLNSRAERSVDEARAVHRFHLTKNGDSTKAVSVLISDQFHPVI